MICAQVEWRHDDTVEPIVTNVVLVETEEMRSNVKITNREYMTENDNHVMPTVGPKNTVRLIHSEMIHRIDSSKGGYCKTAGPDGGLLFVQPDSLSIELLGHRTGEIRAANAAPDISTTKRSKTAKKNIAGM